MEFMNLWFLIMGTFIAQAVLMFFMNKYEAWIIKHEEKILLVSYALLMFSPIAIIEGSSVLHAIGVLG